MSQESSQEKRFKPNDELYTNVFNNLASNNLRQSKRRSSILKTIDANFGYDDRRTSRRVSFANNLLLQELKPDGTTQLVTEPFKSNLSDDKIDFNQVNDNKTNDSIEYPQVPAIKSEKRRKLTKGLCSNLSAHYNLQDDDDYKTVYNTSVNRKNAKRKFEETERLDLNTLFCDDDMELTKLDKENSSKFTFNNSSAHSSSNMNLTFLTGNDASFQTNQNSFTYPVPKGFISSSSNMDLTNLSNSKELEFNNKPSTNDKENFILSKSMNLKSSVNDQENLVLLNSIRPSDDKENETLIMDENMSLTLDHTPSINKTQIYTLVNMDLTDLTSSQDQNKTTLNQQSFVTSDTQIFTSSNMDLTNLTSSQNQNKSIITSQSSQKDNKTQIYTSVSMDLTNFTCSQDLNKSNKISTTNTQFYSSASMDLTNLVSSQNQSINFDKNFVKVNDQQNLVAIDLSVSSSESSIAKENRTLINDEDMSTTLSQSLSDTAKTSQLTKDNKTQMFISANMDLTKLALPQIINKSETLNQQLLTTANTQIFTSSNMDLTNLTASQSQNKSIVKSQSSQKDNKTQIYTSASMDLTNFTSSQDQNKSTLSPKPSTNSKTQLNNSSNMDLTNVSTQNDDYKSDKIVDTENNDIVPELNNQNNSLIENLTSLEQSPKLNSNKTVINDENMSTTLSQNSLTSKKQSQDSTNMILTNVESAAMELTNIDPTNTSINNFISKSIPTEISEVSKLNSNSNSSTFTSSMELTDMESSSMELTSLEDKSMTKNVRTMHNNSLMNKMSITNISSSFANLTRTKNTSTGAFLKQKPLSSEKNEKISDQASSVFEIPNKNSQSKNLNTPKINSTKTSEIEISQNLTCSNSRVFSPKCAKLNPTSIRSSSFSSRRYSTNNAWAIKKDKLHSTLNFKNHHQSLLKENDIAKIDGLKVAQTKFSAFENKTLPINLQMNVQSPLFNRLTPDKVINEITQLNDDNKLNENVQEEQTDENRKDENKLEKNETINKELSLVMEPENISINESVNKLEVLDQNSDLNDSLIKEKSMNLSNDNNKLIENVQKEQTDENREDENKLEKNENKLEKNETINKELSLVMKPENILINESVNKLEVLDQNSHLNDSSIEEKSMNLSNDNNKLIENVQKDQTIENCEDENKLEKNETVDKEQSHAIEVEEILSNELIENNQNVEISEVNEGEIESDKNKTKNVETPLVIEPEEILKNQSVNKLNVLDQNLPVKNNETFKLSAPAIKITNFNKQPDEMSINEMVDVLKMNVSIKIREEAKTTANKTFDVTTPVAIQIQDNQALAKQNQTFTVQEVKNLIDDIAGCLNEEKSSSLNDFKMSQSIHEKNSQESSQSNQFTPDSSNQIVSTLSSARKPINRTFNVEQPKKIDDNQIQNLISNNETQTLQTNQDLQPSMSDETEAMEICEQKEDKENFVQNDNLVQEVIESKVENKKNKSMRRESLFNNLLDLEKELNRDTMNDSVLAFQNLTNLDKTDSTISNKTSFSLDSKRMSSNINTNYQKTELEEQVEMANKMMSEKSFFTGFYNDVEMHDEDKLKSFFFKYNKDQIRLKSFNGHIGLALELENQYETEYSNINDIKFIFDFDKPILKLWPDKFYLFYSNKQEDQNFIEILKIILVKHLDNVKPSLLNKFRTTEFLINIEQEVEQMVNRIAEFAKDIRITTLKFIKSEFKLKSDHTFDFCVNLFGLSNKRFMVILNINYENEEFTIKPRFNCWYDEKKCYPFDLIKSVVEELNEEKVLKINKIINKVNFFIRKLKKSYLEQSIRNALKNWDA